MQNRWFHHIIILICFYFLSHQGYAQSYPFQEDIAAFQSKDSIDFPQKNAILFIGSSSFTKWTDVQQYFPDYPIINRGFGGATLPDVIRYADKIIFPYLPKQVVIYCGENDFATSDTVSAQTVYNRALELFTLIRQRLPRTNITFISIKPSPSRENLMPKIAEANKLIRKFLRPQTNTDYIDVYSKMIDKNKKPISGIFVDDKLHMNAAGYDIWQKAILPHLMK